MSVSYDRVLEISTEVTNAACQRYTEEGVVCPSKLKFNLFTSSAIDNIDHNPSSTTAQGSFHGTGISLFQHPSKDNEGVDRAKPLGDSNLKPQSKSVKELPGFYEEVPPVIMRKDASSCPKTPDYQASTIWKLNDSMQQQNGWLTHVDTVLKERQVDHSDVSWAVYNSKNKDSVGIIQSISSLLPLFTENADSAAMLKHGMDVISQATSYLNPGQIPVIAADQPLYATMKQIQWQYPATHGEDKMVIMMGGLHIEMGFLKLLGNLLMDSGWTDMIVAAQIASSGKADSFLRGAHVRRTRRAHEVTACALYHLLRESYEDSTTSFEDWIDSKSKNSPTFKFWLMVLNLELLILSFVGSLRSGNFCEYIRHLEAMTPWMFALDHTNYARWMPVHIRDMKNISHTHPHTIEEFKKGHFVVHKTERAFSAISLDHAHEQNNASIKGDGGAIGLTENASALRRWTVGGPEVKRILEEFDASINNEGISSTSHHEQSKGMQESFYIDVTALINVIREFGSPFLEHGPDLLVISTRDIAETSVVESLNKIESLGKDQYNDFVKERFINGMPLSKPIKKNKLSLLSSPQTKSQSSSKMQVVSLKNDCSLFSRLYISCQTREGNLDEFFKHENQHCPPSLSHLGILRSSVKSQLLQCLEDVSCPTVNRPEIDVTILDGAAVANMMKPGEHKTFSAFSDEVFARYLENQLENTTRLDIVWDVYKTDSLKASARSRRGRGQRRRVEPHSFIPHNWKEFLRSDSNKTELFQFLGKQAMKTNTDKLIISTMNETVLSNQPYDVSDLSPCSHEEADTRMILHMSEAYKRGFLRFMIRTVDTDVVVLSISAAAALDSSEVWLAFGTGKQFHYIPAHEIAATLGPRKSMCLPLFHSFTGCDTVSSFSGCGKRKAWQVWFHLEEATDAFESLSKHPDQVTDSLFGTLERFVILMYDRTSDHVSLNEARKYMFSFKGRAIENIPPTSAAFKEHVKRAVYQGGHIWGQSTIRCPDLPDPSQWGWKLSTSNMWEPLWSTIPDVSLTCRELLKCGCSKGCSGRCKCLKAALKCTALCLCGGDCVQ